MKNFQFHLGFLIQTSYCAEAHFLSFHQSSLDPFLSQLNPSLAAQFSTNTPLPSALLRQRDSSLANTLEPFIEQLEFQISSSSTGPQFIRKNNEVSYYLERHVLLNQTIQKINQEQYPQAKEKFSFAVGKLHFALRECYLPTQHRHAHIPLDPLSFQSKDDLLIRSFRALCSPKKQEATSTPPPLKKSPKP